MALVVPADGKVGNYSNQGSNYGCSRHDTQPALGVQNFHYKASIHNPFEEVRLHRLDNGFEGKAFGFPGGDVSPCTCIQATSSNNSSLTKSFDPLVMQTKTQTQILSAMNNLTSQRRMKFELLSWMNPNSETNQS